jgi:hypothetical protein
MATFNLLRNSKVYFTTDLTNSTVNVAALTAAGTQELSILDSFSFSQGVANDVITISESGGLPARGQRSFNTALNPVDFSFSTYIRPYLSGTVHADEGNLWNALFNDKPIAVAAVTMTTAATTATVTTAGVLTLISTAGIPVLTPTSVYIMRGVIGAFASQLNGPLKVTSSSATTLVAQYLTAPSAAAATGATIAMFTPTVNFTQSAWNEYAAVATDSAVGNTAYTELTTARSNLNQLLSFGLVIVIDSTTYVVDNAVLDQASIDFGLDGIATVQWTGKGAALRQKTATVVTTGATTGTLTGGVAGTYTSKSSASVTRYITNKLSTITIDGNIGGGGTAYSIPITGGSIQIANNINYVTPAELGIVNQPIGYYTGSRAITGTLNAYLRSGTGSGQLMSDMLAVASTTIEPEYRMVINIGGSSAATRIELLANGANIQIPTLDAQAVISTAINFTVQGADALQGTASANYDLEATNDLRIRYFSN